MKGEGLEGFAGFGTALSNHPLQLFGDGPILGHDNGHTGPLGQRDRLRDRLPVHRAWAQAHLLKMSNCVSIFHRFILARGEKVRGEKVRSFGRGLRGLSPPRRRWQASAGRPGEWAFAFRPSAAEKSPQRASLRYSLA